MNVSETVKTQTVIVFNSPVFSKIASHMHHAFLYISLPFVNNYDVKLPNFTRKQASTKLYFSSWTWILPVVEFNFRRVRPRLTKQMGRNNRKDCRKENSLFKRRFRCHPASCGFSRPDDTLRPAWRNHCLNLKDWKMKTAKYKLLIRKLLTRKT